MSAIVHTLSSPSIPEGIPKSYHRMSEDHELHPQQAPTPSNDHDLREVVDNVVIETPSSPRESDGPEARERPSLSSLPNELISNIFSHFPPFGTQLSERGLKRAYDAFSFARLNPDYMDIFINSLCNVTSVFSESFRLSMPSSFHAHSPDYMGKPFITFLLRHCRNLVNLEQQCLAGMLQHAGAKIEDICFVDSGLTVPDLQVLSMSPLRCAYVVDPSARVLFALSLVATLEELELQLVSAQVIPDLIDFLSTTSATRIVLSLKEPLPRECVMTLLDQFTNVISFTFSCTPHEFWTLSYLRRLAILVPDVAMIIADFQINVKPPNPNDPTSTAWEDEIRKVVLFRDDLAPSEVPDKWHMDVHILGLHVDHIENAIRQKVDDRRLRRTLKSFFDQHVEETAPIELHLDGRVHPLCTFLRCVEILRRSSALSFVTTLSISHKFVLFAGSMNDTVLSEFFTSMTNIRTIRICVKSQPRLLSPRFFLCLRSMLRIAIEHSSTLRTVLMEDIGELVLQRYGNSMLSDESRVKNFIQAMISWMKDLEERKDLDLDTVITQLKYWDRQTFRTVERTELEEFSIISDMTVQQAESESGIDEEFLTYWQG